MQLTTNLFGQVDPAQLFPSHSRSNGPVLVKHVYSIAAPLYKFNHLRAKTSPFSKTLFAGFLPPPVAPIYSNYCVTRKATRLSKWIVTAEDYNGVSLFWLVSPKCCSSNNNMAEGPQFGRGPVFLLLLPLALNAENSACPPT